MISARGMHVLVLDGREGGRNPEEAAAYLWGGWIANYPQERRPWEIWTRGVRREY
jgi:hypothetical protein